MFSYYFALFCTIVIHSGCIHTMSCAGRLSALAIAFTLPLRYRGTIRLRLFWNPATTKRGLTVLEEEVLCIFMQCFERRPLGGIRHSIHHRRQVRRHLR